MRYPVSDVPQGYTAGLTQSFSESPEGLGFTDDGIQIEGNVTGQLKLWRDGAIVTIQAEISANIVLQCCRCLALVMTSVHPVVTLRCFPETATTSDIHETGEVSPVDDMYTYAGMHLDIRPIIREQVVLAVPPYSYCRQDCQGLCVVCGQNLNGTQCGCSAIQPDARFIALQHVKQTLG